MKQVLFFIALFGVFFTTQAQSKLTLMPEGQINLLADAKGSAYLYLGGPTFKVLESETTTLGIEYMPSLRIWPSGPEGRKLSTLTGGGLFLVNKKSRIKYNLVSYYDGPLREWNIAFGLGYVFSKKPKNNRD
ncbi:MAG: hypothetical protein VW034_05815 [Flavobacteriaceae bacterium]|jgi:hypothetical protein